MMKQKGIFYCLFFLFSIHVFSQISVTPTAAATTLAQTIAGNGVTVSNAALNCGPNAAGTFSYVGANLGVSGGIILTTGVATDPANPGTYFCSVANGNLYNDPDLIAIEPAATNDVCILEFDFVPICNSISVTFVFGSEEYPNFVGSFNDGFGIFLTGPNPGGGNYTSLNIGTLPNGTPVSINNVNAGSNATYFYDNYTSPNNDVAYDGYTVPITSTKSVTPCSTYHMKIAIADAGDEVFDSGVFVGNNAVSCQNAPAITASATPANCSGNNGTALASVTNYTGIATYSWTPGGQNTASISGLSPGTYTCVVGLQLGCGNITQTVTAVVASAGASLNLTSAFQNPKCNNGTNGSASVIVGGGTSPYTYSWNTSPVQTTANATGLPSGTYTVTVQDNTGCQGTATVTLTNPAPIVATTTTTPSTCSSANGSATANVTSGGTAPYAYIWNTSPIQNTQTATGIAAGNYSVLISDVNSCTVAVNAVVSLQNGGWTVSAATPTNVSCYTGSNGAGSVIINNPGANVFTYSWNTNPIQSSQVAAGLPAGNYTCSISDANGCTQTTTVTIAQPPKLIVGALTPTNSKCGSPTGAITVSNVSGGTSPYSFSWNSNPVQTTQSLSNVVPGNYILTITDANGCLAQYPQTVGLTPGLPLSISKTPERCSTGNGTASVSANGTAPYLYVWNTVPVQSTKTAVGLASGSYMVHVTDNYGCSDSIAVSISNIDDILTTVFSTQPGDEIYAEDPIILHIVPSQGWSLDTAFLSDGNITINQNFAHIFQQYGTYYATYYYTSSNGCADSVVYPILVNDYMTLYIPSAFSPNGDGTNDYFRAEGTFIKAFEMSIFDRWGQLVTKLDDINKTWNGTYKTDDAAQDTYVYKGTATDVFGKKVTFQGQINLVR